MWIALALASALFTGITATLSKAGMEKVDSNVGMAIQAPIILLITWVVVIVQHKTGSLMQIDKQSWMYLIGTGVVTSIAYLCYFAAIKAGDVSKAAPVDRLSLVFAILFAILFLKEKVSPQVYAGAAFMAVGALLVATAKVSK